MTAAWRSHEKKSDYTVNLSEEKERKIKPNTTQHRWSAPKDMVTANNADPLQGYKMDEPNEGPPLTNSQQDMFQVC